MFNDEFRRCLETLDIEGARKAHAIAFSHLPMPQSDHEVLVTLHMARTATESIDIKLRAYSHKWLCDHNYPSQLPDRLKPSAERLYPKKVGAVGVSVNFTSEWLKPAANEIYNNINNAIMECYADKKIEPTFVKARMDEARLKTNKILFGKLTIPKIKGS